MPDELIGAPSKEKFDSFLRWFRDTYGMTNEIMLGFFPTPDSVKNTNYYKYFNAYIAKEPDAVPPTEEELTQTDNTTTPDAEVVDYGLGDAYNQMMATLTGTKETGTTELNLPETIDIGGKGVPVNYTLINQKTIDKGDLFNPEPHVLSFYAPVTDAGNLNIDELSKNVYAVWDTGEMYSPNPLTGSEIGQLKVGYYDPIKGTIDLGEAKNEMVYASLTKWAQDNGFGQINPDVLYGDITQKIKDKGAVGNMEKLLVQYTNSIVNNENPSLDLLQEELTKLTPAWQIAHPEEERARMAKQYPLTPAQEAQNREALFSRFDKPEEQFATEVDKLNNTLNDFQQSYDKYKPMQAQLSNDAEGQYANTIINLYENAQNMLGQIKGKGTITTTGYTETGQKMTGERPYQIGQHTPSESATLASVAGNLGVPANQIAALGQKYITDTEHPDFANLTQSEKQELLKAGNVTMNQSSSEAQSEQQAQQQSEWDNLLKKAKAVNYPQRKVRL